MSMNPRPRLAIAGVLAGTLAAGALAGPAMAASDDGSATPGMRKAGGVPPEFVSGLQAGGVPEFVTVRKAGGEGIGYIIGVL